MSRRHFDDIGRRVGQRQTSRVVREDLARRYLSGAGIEIGALEPPLRVPPGGRAAVEEAGPLASAVPDPPGELAIALPPAVTT